METGDPTRGGEAERSVLGDASSQRSSGRGFTLIELMLVVAIIGLLATIAIPQFLRMQIHAKRTEVIINIAGLQLEQMSYYTIHDTMLDAPENPTTPLDRDKHPWEPDLDNWTNIGWAPDGLVYCHYEISPFAGVWGRVIGTCDIDGDGNIAVWWGDIDPKGESLVPTEHMVVRPSPATDWQGTY